MVRRVLRPPHEQQTKANVLNTLPLSACTRGVNFPSCFLPKFLALPPLSPPRTTFSTFLLASAHRSSCCSLSARTHSRSKQTFLLFCIADPWQAAVFYEGRAGAARRTNRQRARYRTPLSRRPALLSRSYSSTAGSIDKKVGGRTRPCPLGAGSPPPPS